MKLREMTVEEVVIIVIVVTLLTFLVLKLTSVILWSWLWVLSPLWILGILLILFLAYLGLVILITWR